MSNIAVQCTVDGQLELCTILPNGQTTVISIESTSTGASGTEPTSSTSTSEPSASSTPTSPSPTTLTTSMTSQSTWKPSTVVVTVTTPLISTSTSDPEIIETTTPDSTHQRSDTRVVAITIGVVGGLAVLILLLYWAVNYLASRRYQDQEERDMEADVAVSMLGTTLKNHRPAPPPPGRPILSRPKRASLLPCARKAVTFERQSRGSYNNSNNNTKHFSDLLARRVSAVHPGTRVFFGSPATKASKVVPPRKPVPWKTGQPKTYAPSGTESLYSDDDADDVSTVLGGTGKSQRTEEAFHPMPPGVSFAKWLNSGRAQELPGANSRPTSSKRAHELPVANSRPTSSKRHHELP